MYLVAGGQVYSGSRKTIDVRSYFMQRLDRLQPVRRSSQPPRHIHIFLNSPGKMQMYRASLLSISAPGKSRIGSALMVKTSICLIVEEGLITISLKGRAAVSTAANAGIGLSYGANSSQCSEKDG
ncbi:hypothetical protein E4U36_003168 [Claviceps purpurea]|nr:hypothetical protein E4U36_003168 [Claviceps purpurea]